MKLILDQNLSHRLLELLSDVFPEAIHVRSVGLAKSDDEVIWQYAADHGRVIVSRDWDFVERSLLRGFPPKVVWVRIPNLTTVQIGSFLRQNREAIAGFVREPEASILILS